MPDLTPDSFMAGEQSDLTPEGFMASLGAPSPTSTTPPASPTWWDRAKVAAEAVPAVTEGLIRKSTEMMGTPLMPESAVPLQNPQTPLEAVGHGAAEFARGLTSPENIGLAAFTGPMAKIAPLVSRAVGGVFSAQMLKNAYDQYPEIRDAIEKRDWTRAAGAITSAVLSGGLGVAAGVHAVGGFGGAASTPEEQAPTWSPAQRAVASARAGVEALTPDTFMADQAAPEESSEGRSTVQALTPDSFMSAEQNTNAGEPGASPSALMGRASDADVLRAKDFANSQFETELGHDAGAELERRYPDTNFRRVVFKGDGWYIRPDTPEKAEGGPFPSEGAAIQSLLGERSGASTGRVIDVQPQDESAPQQQPQKLLEGGSIGQPSAPATLPANFFDESQRQPSTAPAYGRDANILVPGETTSYPARYSVRELADVQPSHNPFSFEPNPAYDYTNDRDYSRTGNAARVVKNAAADTFNPDFPTADSPTAEHGAPIIDQSGNVLGGNSRTMTLARVYQRGGPDASMYRQAIEAKAAQLGLDPRELARFEKPVLVRELGGKFDAARAITDFNKSAPAQLGPEERAVSDGRRLSSGTVQDIAGRLEDLGDQGTLADALRGENGASVLNRLVTDGVMTNQEASGYLDDRGQLTPDAKSRIARALVGRMFDTPAEYRETTPAMRGKLERIAPQLLRVEGRRDWSLTDTTRQALALVEDARVHKMQIDDVARQSGIGSDRRYSPDAIAIAKTLEQGPVKAAGAFRRFANDEALSREGSQGAFFTPPTRAEAFTDAFGGERPSPGAVAEPLRNITDIDTLADRLYGIVKKAAHPENALSDEGAAATFYQLRKDFPELAEIPKDRFDAAMLRLQEQRRVGLTEHGYAHLIPESERNALVYDPREKTLPIHPFKQQGSYYNSLYDRLPKGQLEPVRVTGSRVPELPGETGPYVAGQSTYAHGRLARLQPIELDPRNQKFADAYVTNRSGMELVGRAVGRTDVLGRTHVGVHIGAADAGRMARHLQIITQREFPEGPPAPVADLIKGFERAAQAGKSLVLIADHPDWARHRETALAEELAHAVQSGIKGSVRDHLGSQLGGFFEHPLAQTAARSLASRYPDVFAGSNAAAVEVGVRLMRPAGYRELGLSSDEGRLLAAQYVRALRRNYGSQPAGDIARQVFDAFRARNRGSAVEPSEVPRSLGPPGRSGPGGGTEPDLSGFRPEDRGLEQPRGDQAPRRAGSELGSQEQNRVARSRFGSERGGISPDLLSLGTGKFIQQDVIPTVKRLASDVLEAKDSITRVVAPQTRGEAAEFTGLNLRQRMAQFARRFDQGEQRLREARKFFNNRAPEENYKFIDDIEHGRSTGDVHLDTIARMFRGMLDQRRREVQALGEGALKGFYVNYFPHIFERPEKAEQFFESFFGGKRSMEGPKSFLKHRDFPTFREALDAGLKPVSDNPVDLVLTKTREMDRYLLAHAVLRDLAENGIAKRVSGPGPDARQAEMLGGAPIRPEWSVEKPTDLPPNFVSIRDPIGGGRWHAEESAATVLNNFLSPSLRARSGAYRTLLGVNNVMNQANLGLSAFHLRAVTISSMAARMGLGFVKAMEGHPVDAAFSILTSPAAPFIDYLKGSQVLREWFKPGSEGAPVAAITDALMKGGGRARMDAFYATEAAEKMKAAFRSGNFIGGLLRSPFAAIEYTSKPLMTYLVPRMKLGAFADMAQYEMEKLGPGATVEDVQRAMSNAWDHVENRLGQMTYDNKFWHRTFKDIAMLTVRSVGWNLGDALEVGSAAKAVYQMAKLKRPTDLHGLGFVVGYTVTAALMGAIMQYLHTGKGPQELRDYFFPKREDGRRVVSAPYVKDAYSFVRDPTRTIENKAGPFISTMVEMLNNRDYYDRPIRNIDAPLVKQMQQEAEFIGRQFLPFTLQPLVGNNPKKPHPLPGGDTPEHKVENFLGVTAAPGPLQPGYHQRKR